MPIDPQLRETLAFIARVAHACTSLMHCVVPGEESLGGTLVYAGELSDEGRALIIAGNIAGAASLAATADTSAQKQAIREGAADFLVSNLDEALRILKNEIRKREPVSVIVTTAPDAVVNEMLDRGVLPNLLPPQNQNAPAHPATATFIKQGAQNIASPPSKTARKLLVWQIPDQFKQHPATFDALLQELIPQDDRASRRWLRLSPRYLGPEARRLRSLSCNEETASKLIKKFGPPLT